MTETTETIPQLSAKDPAAHSGDVVGENVAALKALFPQIVTDGKVDFEVLRQLLGDTIEEGEERYGLNWKGKAKARAHALTPTLATLRPAREDSVDWDTTRNLMIEGDNLEVLKCLRKAYAGKVKLIYIDPPYNTGGDFVYPDNYVDSLTNYMKITDQRSVEGALLTSNKEGSGRFHTDWLNMIYPRLTLARELLKNDGAIFISIDDKEVNNLYNICNEIFGAENFIANMVWEGAFKNDADQIGVNHEYILVYAKNKKCIPKGWSVAKVDGDKVLAEERRLRSIHGEDFDAAADEMAGWYRANKSKPVFAHRRFRYFDKNGLYKEDDPTAPGGRKFELIDKRTNTVIPLRKGRGWAFDQDTFDNMVKDGRITFVTDTTIMVRRYFHETDNVTPQSVFYNAARSASERLSKLMGSSVFDFPKDEEVIRQIVEMSSNADDVVMDFFAGSGTTGHAVLAQNAVDGGRRHYVLVQLPEPLNPTRKEQAQSAEFCDRLQRPRNIAELTKERLRRAGAKVRNDNPDAEIDTGFRVYKLDSSNIRPWQPDADNLEASLLDAVSNIVHGRSEEDLLVELLLKTGIDLTTPEEVREIAGKTVHALGGGTLIVCLADIADADAEKLGHGIAEWQAELDPPGQTTLYFKDEGFASACAKANLAAILRQRMGDRIAKLASI